MSIQKPQNPMQYEGKSFYPLTSVDQVIMEDGSRLNSALDDKVSTTGGSLSGLLALKGLSLTYGVDYGPTLPENGVQGQIFFQLDTDN